MRSRTNMKYVHICYCAA